MKIQLVFLIILISPFARAQSAKVSDSLTTVLKNNKLSPKDRIETLNTLAAAIVRNNNKQSKILTQQALTQSRRLNYKKGEGWALLNMARIAQLVGDLDSSLVYVDQALAVKEINTDPSFIGRCLVSQANVFRRKQQQEQSIQAYLKGIAAFEKANDKTGIADCYNGIAALYVGKKDYEQAIDYHKKALKIRHDLGLKLDESMSLGNIGIVKLRQKKYNEALAYHTSSLVIARQINDSARIAFIYNDLGATYSAAKQPLQAIAFLQKSIEMRTKIHETVELPYTLNYLGEAYEQAGQKQKAEYYIKEANRLAIKFHNTKQIQESYESISQFYARNNKTDSAYAYSIKFINYKDSVESADNLKAMDQLMVKFETEKKEQQIKLLNQQTTIDKLSINKQRTAIFVIIALFLLSTIVAFLLYNRNKLKQQALLQEQLLIQQDALTKAVIEAEEHERKRIGSDLHDGVGQLFSTVKLNLNGLFDRIKIDAEADKFLVEKTMALVDESCKEVRHISHQMMPNMLLKSGIASDVKSFIEKIDSEALKVNFEATGFKNKLEDNVEIVLYRVIQESVNNVIKHAKATELDIKLSKSNNEIYAVIKDNGVGFDAARKEDFTGIGLKNIATRIEYLKGSVTYISSPGKGTSVNVMVPIG